MIQSEHMTEVACKATDLATFGRDSVRFQTFDLGTLILKNERAVEIFKSEATEWFIAAQRRFPCYSDDAQLRRRHEFEDKDASEYVSNYFRDIDSWMRVLGKATFDEDQRYYFNVRLNHSLYCAQIKLAEWLADTYAGGLGQLIWSSCCMTSGFYTFQAGKVDQQVLKSCMVERA